VHDAGAVRVLEGGEHLFDDLRGIRGHHRTLRDHVFEQASLDVLHDDERHEGLDARLLAHDLLAGVEDAHDRGVGHLGGILRFTTEAGAERRVVRESGFEQLDGNATAEPGVLADVDVGHAPSTDEFTDLVSAREHAHILRYAVNHELSPGASGGRSMQVYLRASAGPAQRNRAVNRQLPVMVTTGETGDSKDPPQIAVYEMSLPPGLVPSTTSPDVDDALTGFASDAPLVKMKL
jgi:hypothetical protein